MPIDLLTNQEHILLSAEEEANALLMDVFKYENIGTTSSVVLCNNWVFPSDKPARFIRDGSILRRDNFVYSIEIHVDDVCGVREAGGRAGPVPFL